MEETTPGRSRWRPILKMVAVGALVLVLMIPVAQLLGLVRERKFRQDEVKQELSRLWGGEQTVGALVLAVPFRSKVVTPPPAPPPAPGVSAPVVSKGSVALPQIDPGGWLYFLPADVRWRGELRPEIRHRGLFEVPLYETSLAATGWFRRPDTTELGVTADRVDWDGARAALLVNDTRGLQRKVTLRWNGQERPFEPASGPLETLATGIEAPLGKGALTGDRLAFTVDLVLRGSDAFRVLPLGETTRVELTSTWADPGFTGAPLPSAPRVSEKGFSAVWEVPYFARDFPQQWRQHLVDEGKLRGQLALSSFGVTLVRPADPYQQTERAVKYAVLFILLTFTTVFLLELLSPVRLHPVHYLLVGTALCLFYLLLLALAEHVGLPVAYAIATTGIVGVVGLYARAVLAGWLRAGILAAALTALYGWLFTVLRAEDYALLLGALGMFATLAAVMYLTRRLDWATLELREPAASREPATGAG